MCRLCAITSLTMNPDIKLAIMERMLLLSMCDESQIDGVGVSDGLHLWKTGMSAWTAGNLWQRLLDPTRPWIGHLRKKSMGTGGTDLEAHPFFYDTSGGTLIMAHNGFFHGTDYKGWDAKEPSSDTYRAGKQLAALINKSDPAPESLSPLLMETWLSEFEEQSAYSLLMFYRQRLYALRGKLRTLFACELGEPGSWLINTSQRVLALMVDYVKNVHPGVWIDPEIRALPDDMFIRFGELSALGTAESMATLTYAQKRRTYHSGTAHVIPYGTTATHWSNTAGGGEASNAKKGDESESESGDENAASTASLTTRGSAITTPLRNRGMSVDAIVLREIENWLSVALGPLSRPMITFWVCSSLGVLPSLPDGTKALPKKTLAEMDVSGDDLGLFVEMLLSNSVLDDYSRACMPLLTQRQRTLVNVWNHRVSRAREVEMHMRIFGTDPFWLNNSGVQDADDLTNRITAFAPSSQKRRALDIEEDESSDGLFSR